jgi:transcriptional regulator with XRE-family HTH domain
MNKKTLPPDIAAARKRAEQVRQKLAHKPSVNELLTTQERDDAAPFYFVLRRFIAKVKSAREAAELTLAVISERTGMAVESLSRLETGALTNPTWKSLALYAKAVGQQPLLSAVPATKNKRRWLENRFSSIQKELKENGAAMLDRTSVEKLRIGPPIYLEPPEGFGFPQFRVFEVLARPTDRAILKIDDFSAWIFAKTTADYADVVCIQDIDNGKHKIVAFAFRAFPDLCDVPLAELCSLDIVQKMADRFGLMMHIGREEGKFFLKADFEKPTIIIPGRDENSVLHFDLPPSKKAITGAALKVEGDRVKIALAFGIDPDAYQKWLETHSGSHK